MKEITKQCVPWKMQMKKKYNQTIQCNISSIFPENKYIWHCTIRHIYLFESDWGEHYNKTLTTPRNYLIYFYLTFTKARVAEMMLFCEELVFNFYIFCETHTFFCQTHGECFSNLFLFRKLDSPIDCVCVC